MLNSSVEAVVENLYSFFPAASKGRNYRCFVFRCEVDVPKPELIGSEVEFLRIYRNRKEEPSSVGVIKFNKGKKSGAVKKNLKVGGDVWWVPISSTNEWASIKPFIDKREGGLDETFLFSRGSEEVQKKEPTYLENLLAHRHIYKNMFREVISEEFENILEKRGLKSTIALETICADLINRCRMAYEEEAHPFEVEETLVEEKVVEERVYEELQEIETYELDPNWVEISDFEGKERKKKKPKILE